MNPIPVTVAAHPRRSKPPSRFSIRYCAFPWCLAPAEFSSSRVVLTTPNSIFSRSLLPSPVPVHCSDFLPMLDPALLVLVVTLRFSFPPCVFVLRRVEFISGFCLPRVFISHRVSSFPARAFKFRHRSAPPILFSCS
jgi:hypothetical protein